MVKAESSELAGKHLCRIAGRHGCCTVRRFASGFTTLGLATAEPIQGPEKVSGKLIGAREHSVFRICSAPGKRPLSYMSIRQRTHVHFSRKLIRRLKRFRFLRLLRENPYPCSFLSRARSWYAVQDTAVLTRTQPLIRDGFDIRKHPHGDETHFTRGNQAIARF